TRNALAQGADVVIDRCNFDKRQRETWLRIARQFHADVYCLELKTNLALCRARIMNRHDHPTQVQGTFGTTVLDRQKAQYQP
ncbi:AAA domain-domain-containing protein, partial [Protomyces lactucae-debilis]